MTVDWWTLGLQTVNVLILVWLLARFLFRPVSKIVAERQAAAHKALDEAEAAREAAEEDRAAAAADRAGIGAARAKLMEEARAAADTEAQRLSDAARAAADKARDETRAELDKMRREAREALTDEAAALAADIADRLLDRLPETARIDGFIDGLAEAVRDLPEATRDGIAADGRVPLHAARALTKAERARLEARLAEVLGRDVTLGVETDPDLIAGLELDAPHATVRNHFRADLDRIRREVLAHD